MESFLLAIHEGLLGDQADTAAWHVAQRRHQAKPSDHVCCVACCPEKVQPCFAHPAMYWFWNMCKFRYLCFP